MNASKKGSCVLWMDTWSPCRWRSAVELYLYKTVESNFINEVIQREICWKAFRTKRIMWLFTILKPALLDYRYLTELCRMNPPIPGQLELRPRLEAAMASPNSNNMTPRGWSCLLTSITFSGLIYVCGILRPFSVSKTTNGFRDKRRKDMLGI